MTLKVITQNNMTLKVITQSKMTLRVITQSKMTIIRTVITTVHFLHNS
jgi:hypothetical protein